MQLIKIEEDKVFPLDQRLDRKYVMGKVDEELAALEDRREARLQRQIELQRKDHERQQRTASFKSEYYQLV